MTNTNTTTNTEALAKRPAQDARPTFNRERFYESPYQRHNFSAEASELGLKPGEWPSAFDTDLGNGQACILDHHDEHGSGIYHQIAGCVRVTIFND